MHNAVAASAAAAAAAAEATIAAEFCLAVGAEVSEWTVQIAGADACPAKYRTPTRGHCFHRCRCRRRPTHLRPTTAHERAIGPLAFTHTRPLSPHLTLRPCGRACPPPHPRTAMTLPPPLLLILSPEKLAKTSEGVFEEEEEGGAAAGW